MNLFTSNPCDTLGMSPLICSAKSAWRVQDVESGVERTGESASAMCVVGGVLPVDVVAELARTEQRKILRTMFCGRCTEKESGCRRER